MKNVMPEVCKARKCSGDFAREKEFCEAFEKVERDGKIYCAWATGEIKNADDEMINIMKKLCIRKNCSGVFQKRPDCAIFEKKKDDMCQELMLIIEEK
ncbi:MAG: hypothetical protein QXS93_02410 [Candidatus Micrarchaeia archaeon]